jgi:hypothetical protein
VVNQQWMWILDFLTSILERLDKTLLVLHWAIWVQQQLVNV